MIRDGRLAICAVLSIVGHFAVAHTLERLPRRQETPSKRILSIRVIAPPPAPEPPPEPAAPQPVPQAIPHEIPRAHRTSSVAPEAAPKAMPPPDVLPHAGDSTAPVFGVTMESTSQSGTGPSVPVGNSATAPEKSGDEHGAAKALAPPVPEYQVTTMPLPQGRCGGVYSEELRQEAVEGIVVLDLVISETGRVREVHVVSGDPRLTEAAIKAAKACPFSPGEKDGVPVPVRVRQFKIRFFLDQAE